MGRMIQAAVSARVGSFEELSADEQDLLREAARVRLNAQAPYSKYLVGAAVLTENGKLYAGCNVERASYTQTTHAEQNAIDSMVADAGPTKIRKLAIIGGPKDRVITFPPKITGPEIESVGELCPSCGHCLQIIWENSFGDPDVKLLELLANGEVASTTIGSALPMRFGPLNLGVDYRERGKKL